MINTDESSASATRSLRINEHNPLHHLWNNHGTWWIHYTEHLADFTKRRIRKSLGTPHLAVALRLRDELLNSSPNLSNVTSR